MSKKDVEANCVYSHWGALNLLAEATTAELTRVEDPQGLEENRAVSKRGGTVAGNARREIEAQTGRPVITAQNAVQLNGLVTQLIESAPSVEDGAADEGLSHRENE